MVFFLNFVFQKFNFKKITVLINNFITSPNPTETNKNVIIIIRKLY